MRVCSSTNATTVRRLCGQSGETAACSALSTPCHVRRSKNGLTAAHDTTGGAGYPLIGLVTSECVRFDRGDRCTQGGMNDPPLTSTTMPVRNAAVSDEKCYDIGDITRRAEPSDRCARTRPCCPLFF